MMIGELHTYPIDLYVKLVHLNGHQQVFLTTFLFDLTDSKRPPAELKVASELSDQNPVGTLYEFIFVLNSYFYENIIFNAHYKTHTFSMSLCQKNMFR